VPTPPLTALTDLKQRLDHLGDLGGAMALLRWDEATHLPAGGGEARGRQVATLGRILHERFVDPEIGRLLDRAEREVEGRPYDDPDAALVRVTRYDYEQATRIPPSFSAEFGAHSAEQYARWSEAREAGDVSIVIDGIERTLELSRRFSDYLGPADHPADVLIDQSDRGMTVARLRPLFAELRAGLVPLVEAVTGAEPLDDALLRQHYDADEQLAAGLEIAQAFGYDAARGRQDTSPHPFAIGIAVDDVRITTRVNEGSLIEGLYSTLHEAGHAMYEQGIDPAFDGTPLGGGVSSGVHESQSRLWENLVGRSRPFWEFALPLLQRRFPEQLAAAEPDTMYRAVNRVSHSPIRTQADELTYNLHVIVRFDLECALLEGSLAVADLAEAWRARYATDLGVEIDDDRDGVLQDIHWFAGPIGGAFQGYTVGNVLSAQLFGAATAAHPEIVRDGGRGRFGALHGWLRETVYRHGRAFTPTELIARATGGPLTAAPYLRYLDRKYRELYSLD
jgi:carboxypeptidase Taq